ncbi:MULTISPECIES: hypothetical protein [unclassified Psychrobacter]|uniref:hypothetical protein n=1 Tax=unclassified Psychrobacter TaxID=196806 RepID=UPI00384BE0DC
MSHIANQSKYTRHYHPRHLLAQYAINQIATLELRSQDIVKAMGYPIKHTIPACERLRHVLSNKYLGLDGSYMDKYFTADEFLIALFTVLEIPHAPFAEDIAQIKDAAEHDNKNSSYGSVSNGYQQMSEQDYEMVDRVGEYKLKKSKEC